MECGRAIATLTREMQGADELFASTLTLRAVEAQLLIVAHTLGQLLELAFANGSKFVLNTQRRGIRCSSSPEARCIENARP